MLRCLELARQGLGLVDPNPMVGSVIVHKGRIIGEGWHQKSGTAHAEVHAINSVVDKRCLSESTLYVNLEPCSHFGQTPPCSDLILKSNIKKVVIGVVDVNEKVKGKGVARLKKGGVEVVLGVLEDECITLNKRFFTFHQKQRPYIILKWAQTSDGFIFPEKDKAITGEPYWITNSLSLQRSHNWRGQEAGILVGNKTVLQDNPSLNVRDYEGKGLIRMVIDKELKITKSSNFFNGAMKTFIFNGQRDDKIGDLNFVQIDFSNNVINQILNYLHHQEVQSLIVEGGSYTLNKFIQAGCWDEARVFIGDNTFRKGLKAPERCGKLIKEEQILKDRLYWYVNR